LIAFAAIAAITTQRVAHAWWRVEPRALQLGDSSGQVIEGIQRSDS
jgi:hypothetical protein